MEIGVRFVVGVDVGTGSARAGVFDRDGKLLAQSKAEIAINRPYVGHVEQSSEDIWQAVCTSVRAAVDAAAVSPGDVGGIAFSSTCSLVLRDARGAPLELSPGQPRWDIIVWMDHRAVKEAQECTASEGEVLNRLGGKMSPEMQIPKIMWLKRHRPDLWARLGYAGDLGDFLTWQCTGENTRSICSLGCKWTFDPEESAWSESFLVKTGLEDVRAKAALPNSAHQVGDPVGRLSRSAAKDLGLTEHCSVATGLIDAHAGALGTLGLFLNDGPEQRVALIAGTSNCQIAMSKTKLEVPGVWGPYLGAVAPEFFVNEGGQSATGALLDYVVSLFAPGVALGRNAHARLSSELLIRMSEGRDLAPGLQVQPDFIGNRSPYADPDMRGEITGMTIEPPDEAFRRIYWATAASIAYGTRLILDRMNASGYQIRTIHLSGGHASSELLVRLYADATGCHVILSPSEEPVLLGAAMAAWAQFEGQSGLQKVAKRIRRNGTVIVPDAQWKKIHDDRYARFEDHVRGTPLERGRAAS